MHDRRSILVLLLIPIFSISAFAQPAAPASAPADDPSAELIWPRKKFLDGSTILVYQPQIDSWEGNKIEARAAVSFTAQGETDPKFGVIGISARTDIDKSTRMVSLEDITISKVSFPDDKTNEPNYLVQINRAVPDTADDIPLDHLEANFAIANAGKAAAAVPVLNNVPNIIFETKPSILVLIDGEPVLKPVPQSTTMRVVNTRALILLDPASKQYYLSVMGFWVKSSSAAGPWTPSPQTPPGSAQIKESLSKANTVDLMIPNNPDGAPQGLPVVYTSTKPAELIQSRDDPEYSPIAGTNLLYMKNCESAVFMTVGASQYYVLVSGRWFTAPALKGPWTYVAGKDLPPDFAKIPPDSAKANALVSVPGTAQASEALIANAIPQTASVSISDTKLTVTYDGTPSFKDIESAPEMQYAVNCSQPVILVKQSRTYYCVSSGVWFSSTAPMGPWVVTSVVPTVIYTIPVSCPIHYVTYVRIYGVSGDIVYVGYTPGYMGTCVSSDGVVVYGTGYYYPAYVGDYWVGYPVTYGYGAGFACGIYTGFAFGFAAGAIIGDCWCHPYWGPCWGYGSVDINTHSVYTNWRGGVTTVNRHYDYDPWTGKSSSMGKGASFNPYTGRASVGGYSNYLDRSSGDFDVKRAGATYNPRTGTITAGGSRNTGNIYDGTGDSSRGAIRYNTNTNTGVAVKDGDVYAGRDGNVYRRTDDGWQQHTDSGWQDASRGGGQNFAQQRQNLESQNMSRNVGQQRFDGVRSSGNFSRPAGRAVRGRR